MGFLYGDSTPSKLKSDFLEFLRDALDFSVFVVQADARIQAGEERAVALRKEADAHMAQLDAYVSAVTRTILQEPKGASDSPTARCAAKLAVLTAEALRASLDEVRTTLARDLAQVEAQESTERTACLKMLEALLSRHDPPDASIVQRVELGPSDVYVASLIGKAEFGLDWTLDLSIPDSWSAPVRIERLLPELEIQAPQLSGWITKDVKIRPQRLERYFITEVVDDGLKVTLKLRPDPRMETGFDVTVRPETKHVTVCRVGPADDGATGPFDVEDGDKPRLVELTKKVRLGLGEFKRGSLSSAAVEGHLFWGLPRFSPFVQRLVSMMAPIAKEIAERSLVPTELVIRRLVSDARREEIFVSKAVLREKYAALPQQTRALFAPLGLDAPTEIKRPSKRPPDKPPPVRRELLQSTPPPPKTVALPAERVSVTALGPPPTTTNATRTDGAAGGPRPAGAQLLESALKNIKSLVDKGSIEDAYRAYAALFSNPVFSGYRLEQQRQALKLMVLAKTPPPPSEAVVAAHRAALMRLKWLVHKHGDPGDYEMLGISHLVLSEGEAAKRAFEAALKLARERDPKSELCGSLEKRVSAL